MRNIIFVLAVLSSATFACDKDSYQSIHPFAELNDMLVSDDGKIIEIYFPDNLDGLPLTKVYVSKPRTFGGLLLLSNSRDYIGYKFVQIALGSDVIDKVEVSPGYESKEGSLCQVQGPPFKLSKLLKAERPPKTGNRY